MTNAGKVTNPLFGLGKPNDAFAQYFIGESFLNPLTDPEKTIFLANVTFEPGCRNNWHIHHADKGGGQILLCTDGRGWCQFWGEEARELHPGDVVFIPAGVKHWHGAAKDSWFRTSPSRCRVRVARTSGSSRSTARPMTCCHRPAFGS